ncbi:MAG TPA: glycoside hydrolase family 3 N-terminal domain-containing protein [Candidatus Limnocylindrales bacterium]
MGDARLTRRRLLRGAGLVALGATGATAPGACGGPPASAPGTATPLGTTAPAATTDEQTLRRKIASLLVVGFRESTVDANHWVMKAITEQGLGGVILFDRDQLTGQSRNINSPDQVRSLISTLKGAAANLIVSVDQEGGVTSRLNPRNGFPATQSEAEVGAAGNLDVTREWARNLAQMVGSTGFTFNFTPVVDLNLNPSNPAVGELGRSFSADPQVVVANATEEVRQHREAKVKTSLKHFPGLGSATGNTDFSVVDVSDTWKPVELEPFRSMVASGMTDSIMVAHILNRQIDPDLPMSLSRAAVTDLLRGQVGWKGAAVSDDMQAVAIDSRYGRDEAVALALNAGMDLLVFANQQVYDPGIVTGVVDGVMKLLRDNRITEARIDEAVARVNPLRP